MEHHLLFGNQIKHYSSSFLRFLVHIHRPSLKFVLKLHEILNRLALVTTEFFKLYNRRTCGIQIVGKGAKGRATGRRTASVKTRKKKWTYIAGRVPSSSHLSLTAFSLALPSSHLSPLSERLERAVGLATCFAKHFRIRFVVFISQVANFLSVFGVACE